MGKFNLLSYIMPPEDKVFYHFFEDSAKICHAAALLFNEIVNSNIDEQYVIKAKTFKHKSNDILKDTLLKLNQATITPIDSEDIQLIATQMNKITKKVVKACVNLRVYRLKCFTTNMKEQAKTLLKATEELIFIMGHFKKISSTKEMTESNLRMKEIESHGDEVLYQAMDDLFSDKYEALDVIKMRDIHKDIENALDNCFLISDEVVNIVLKQT